MSYSSRQSEEKLPADPKSSLGDSSLASTVDASSSLAGDPSSTSSDPSSTSVTDSSRSKTDYSSTSGGDVTSRLARPTAASKARQGEARAKHQPKPPAKPAGPTRTVAVVTAPPRRKACSTPTKEDVTLSDLTLDASCIPGREPTLDTTLGPPAPLQRGVLRGSARVGGRGKPPVMQSLSSR